MADKCCTQEESSRRLTLHECLELFWLVENEPDSGIYSFQVPPLPDVDQELLLVSKRDCVDKASCNKYMYRCNACMVRARLSVHIHWLTLRIRHHCTCPQESGLSRRFVPLADEQDVARIQPHTPKPRHKESGNKKSRQWPICQRNACR